MMLRTSSPFEQSLADMRSSRSRRYASFAARATFWAKTHHGSSHECFSITNRDPSFDGQQASPSAMLSVAFQVAAASRAGQLGEPNVGKPLIRATALKFSHRTAVQGFSLRGILRFSNLFHYHKGPEYVQ